MATIFLDLEETVIDFATDEFKSCDLLQTNIEKIRRILLPTSTVSLFSFAIWGNREKKQLLDSGLLENLESLLDHQISRDFPTRAEIKRVVEKKKKSGTYKHRVFHSFY